MLTARQQLKRRVDALRRVPLLAACTNAELARVDGLGAQVDVRAGRTLTHEGEDGRECFVVLEGIATASRGDAQLGVIGPGSIVGEMALLFAVPRTATVVALTPMRLLVLSVNEFNALLDVAPCIRQNMYRIGDERRYAMEAGGCLPPPCRWVGEPARTTPAPYAVRAYRRTRRSA